jgi:hypothetical protein
LDVSEEVLLQRRSCRCRSSVQFGALGRLIVSFHWTGRGLNPVFFGPLVVGTRVSIVIVDVSDGSEEFCSGGEVDRTLDDRVASSGREEAA